LNTRQHLNNVEIISDFVRHCNLRDLSPITCSFEDLIFYLDSVFLKTKHNKQNRINANIHQVKARPF
jgi:hypothetical protein